MPSKSTGKLLFYLCLLASSSYLQYSLHTSERDGVRANRNLAIQIEKTQVLNQRMYLQNEQLSALLIDGDKRNERLETLARKELGMIDSDQRFLLFYTK